MDWLSEQTVIQAGGIAVALVAISAMVYMVKRFTVILGNHLDHETAMRNRDIESRDMHTKSFVELVEMIKNHFNK